MKNIYLIILILGLFARVAYAQEVPKLRIDPAQARGGTVSEYFSTVTYIPLETTKESLFGAIQGFDITDSSFVISDQDTRAVLFFSKTGKFIRKLKFRQDQYPYANYLKQSKIVMVSVYDQKEQKTVTTNYSITGLPLGIKTELASDSKMSHSSLGDDYFLRLDNCYFDEKQGPKDTIVNQISILKKDSIVKSFLPVNQSQNLAYCAFAWGPRTTASHNQQGVYYASIPFTHDIYKITKDSIYKIYRFVFPMSRTMPKDYLQTDRIKLVDSLRNARNWDKDLITTVSNLYFHKNLVLFKIDARYYVWYTGSESTQQYNFIYDLTTGQLASFERITPDAGNYYLPVSGGMWTGIRGLIYTEGYFYTSISSLQMFTAKENTKDKKPKYNATLEDYFKTSDRKSNPVVVQLKLKD